MNLLIFERAYHNAKCFFKGLEWNGLERWIWNGKKKKS